ncbi:hypothetical protein [Pseudomonas sp. MWU13-2105]|nr:hypothetical protein [Pseudomonas sp. MWU13-2105]
MSLLDTFKKILKPESSDDKPQLCSAMADQHGFGPAQGLQYF